jgi:hypothetical protein
MPKLARFSTPARLPDANADAWNARVRGLMENYLDGSLPQFYDPTVKNTPASAQRPMVSWVAFPNTLRAQIPSQRERWKLADGDRGNQDEYCEWAVTRNSARKITKVTFTTELPEYFEHLNDTAPARLVRLYRKLVDPGVELAHLRNSDGTYRRINRWNRGNRLAHLSSGPNNLFAAIDLVARATVLRVKNGQPVTNQQELVACAGLGNPLRNSDPQIASAVNVAAGEGNEITLANPLGLHLGRPLTAGMVTPDGADAARFWKIERGDAEHTVRARFEVPKQRGYVVGDIEIGGRPIKFGGQVAERVQVWVQVIVKPGDHKPKPRRCGV